MDDGADLECQEEALGLEKTTGSDLHTRKILLQSIRGDSNGQGGEEAGVPQRNEGSRQAQMGKALRLLPQTCTTHGP